MSGPGARGDPGGPEVARARLAAGLRASGRTPSAAVQAAFASVPRHLFVPELTPAAAYADDALVIKYDSDGLPVSSSSQPAMMAIMLEQLGLAPGHRVLEIGTGTGYNAAVLAHIVGPGGRVVTIDIDPGLVARAQASLVAAGAAAAVQARSADGGFGDPGGAPFDRVIVTAGTWDIAPAWLDQLAPGGRLVLPLSVRGIQLSVALQRHDEHWAAASAFRCGFVRMAGAFADPEPFRPLGSARYAQAGGGPPAAAGILAAALAAGPAAEAGTGIGAAGLGDLDLWLTVTQPGLGRLTVISTAPGGLLPFGGLTRGHGAADLGVAALAVADGEIVVRGYGPGGPALAADLAGRAPEWTGRGQPGAGDLRLAAWPAGIPLRAADGQAVLRRPHVTLVAGWPAP
jgi:protein-L-isoaspartate(D-aspartate) O-methyltransferase